jgi:hypothetical protein
MTENSTRVCAFSNCGKPFAPVKRHQRFCSATCRAANHYAPKQQETKERRQKRVNDRFAARNRDRSLSFDGRYGGPGLSEERPTCFSRDKFVYQT